MTRIFDIAHSYVDSAADLDPTWATLAGVTGYEDHLTDYSLGAEQQRQDLDRRTFEEVNAATPEGEPDRLARDVMLERLSRSITRHQSDEPLRNVGVSSTPVQSIRGVFDEMARQTKDDWRLVVDRMAAVPDSMSSYIDLLREGMSRGVVSSRRQALGAARQARVWAGLEPDSTRFFCGMVGEYENGPSADRKIAEALRRSCVLADNAYDELATFLVKEYAPSAPDHDGVGRDRYQMWSGEYLGDDIDLDETYAWGWEELRRVQAEVEQTCHQIAPGEPLAAVIEVLDDDHERWVTGERALTQWLHGLLERAYTRLNGPHFDIPDAIAHLEVRIAPPGGMFNRYYTAPSEDLTRPGIYWYPTLGRNRFAMWSEISTAYHEGFPGHHLLTGYARCMTDTLSRFQRTLQVPGHEDGWSLYAERLMDDFGFLERPEYQLDMLLNSLFRAARVVIDIGLHLGLSIPQDQPFHPGEQWSPELATELVGDTTAYGPELIGGEIERYLGIPGQAISYKLGEKGWLDARRSAQSTQGSQFDLKSFHMKALSVGPMGLAQLRKELVSTDPLQ